MSKQAKLRAIGVTDYDTADYLRDEEEGLLYLQACLDEAGDDAAFIAKAIGTVLKSRRDMARVADVTGLSRESLYKSLSGKRSPTFDTVLRVLDALGLKLQLSAKAPAVVSQDVRVAPQVAGGYAYTLGDLANNVLWPEANSAVLGAFAHHFDQEMVAFRDEWSAIEKSGAIGRAAAWLHLAGGVKVVLGDDTAREAPQTEAATLRLRATDTRPLRVH